MFAKAKKKKLNIRLLLPIVGILFILGFAFSAGLEFKDGKFISGSQLVIVPFGEINSINLDLSKQDRYFLEGSVEKQSSTAWKFSSIINKPDTKLSPLSTPAKLGWKITSSEKLSISDLNETKIKGETFEIDFQDLLDSGFAVSFKQAGIEVYAYAIGDFKETRIVLDPTIKFYPIDYSASEIIGGEVGVKDGVWAIIHSNNTGLLYSKGGTIWEDDLNAYLITGLGTSCVSNDIVTTDGNKVYWTVNCTTGSYITKSSLDQNLAKASNWSSWINLANTGHGNANIGKLAFNDTNLFLSTSDFNATDKKIVIKSCSHIDTNCTTDGNWSTENLVIVNLGGNPIIDANNNGLIVNYVAGTDYNAYVQFKNFFTNTWSTAIKLADCNAGSKTPNPVVQGFGLITTNTSDGNLFLARLCAGLAVDVIKVSRISSLGISEYSFDSNTNTTGYLTVSVDGNKNFYAGFSGNSYGANGDLFYNILYDSNRAWSGFKAIVDDTNNNGNINFGRKTSNHNVNYVYSEKTNNKFYIGSFPAIGVDEIIIPNVLTADFTYSFLNGNYLDSAAGKNTVIMDFNDLSSPAAGGTIVDWNWMIDSVKVSDDQNLHYIFTTDGNHTVLLAVRDSNGNDQNRQKTVTIYSAIQAVNIIMDFNSIKATAANVSFDLNVAYSGNADGFLWLKDGNNISSGSPGVHLIETIAGDVNYCVIVKTMNSIPDYNKTACLNLSITQSILVNEEDGSLLTTADFNGDAPKHIKKIIVYDINGVYLFDFNSSSSTSVFFVSEPIAYNFEITYNNAGLDVKDKKEIDFSLLDVTTARICIAPLQTFYEQIFTSVQERQIVMYLPTASCYTLAATLRNSYQQGLFTNVFTINKTYQAYTFIDGVKTFLAWINGGSEYSHDLDALEINRDAIEISIGFDTLAFVPLLNTLTKVYDTNTLQIYFKSYYGTYTSTNLKIYNGETLLYELTEDANANEFVINWDWSAYDFTDQNTLKIITIGTNSDGTQITLTEYFTISGQSYIGTKDPTFIAIMVILFFLFGITITTVGRTFGWLGIVICIISMAISLMALPGYYWISMIQAGLFICFLYIILAGTSTAGIAKGMR